jgi:uncharacterized membrane protein YeiH
VTLGSYDLGWSVFAAVAGGLVADVVVRLTPRVPAHAALYIAAALFPFVTWAAYFVIVRVVYERPWPADFALGVAAFAALALTAVNFVLTLPDAP